MTRSLDDCFARGQGLMPVAEALERLKSAVEPVVATQNIALPDAAGRILAAGLVAPRNVPAFDNTAVDGFAFAHASLTQRGPIRLPLVAGRAAAGHPFAGTVPPGHALRVLTGAPLPPGVDSIAMQEDCSVEGDVVVIPGSIHAHANHRRAGEDIARGREVLVAGCRLRPQEIGVAAEMGLAELPVFERLKVALFSSGDELCEPGTPLPDGGVYDANRYILRALLDATGCAITDLGILADDAQSVRQALTSAAAHHHVVLTSGGASHGDEDHVVRTVQTRGALNFWRIAMKPGRPLAFGRLGEAVFVGLPGNPVAAMVCFLRFARPVLLRLGGMAWSEPQMFPVRAAFEMTKKPGRTEMLRATLERHTDGTLWARRIEREGSGMLTSLSEADGLVELGEDVTAVQKGQTVPFLPLAQDTVDQRPMPSIRRPTPA